MKRLFNLFLAVVMIFSFTCIQVYAANGTGGSGNIDGGGGSMGDATSHGSWNPGNEGVRVTVVRATKHHLQEYIISERSVKSSTIMVLGSLPYKAGIAIKTLYNQCLAS